MKLHRLLFVALALASLLVSMTWASVPTAQPGPEAARLSGSPAKVTDDLFEVRFVEINGENIPPREFIWLAPGSYTVTVAILADMTLPRLRGAGARDDQGPEGYNVIELELEAGKTYQIRGRYNKDQPDRPFSVILHRVDVNE